MRSDDREEARQLERIRKALLKSYDDVIDMSDYEGRSQSDREKDLLSRALAAQAVRIKTGCDLETGARAVIDGRDDQGIDAIAFSDTPARVWVVQAKWSGKGTAGLDKNAVLKLLEGVQYIDDELAIRFNARAQALVKHAKDLLTEHHATMTLVIALMSAQPLHPDIETALKDGIARLNRFDTWLDYEVLYATDFAQQVREDLQPPPITVAAHLTQWHSIADPHTMYSGVVPAEEIAGWYSEHGNSLFEHNIRNPLGLTSTTREIVETLLNAPQNFVCLNNGITVVCNGMETVPTFKSAPHRGPMRVIASKASVVNGAQTVRAIDMAMREQPETAAQALVNIKIVDVGGAEGFARLITDATNRQNRVEPRDFVALDPVQSEIHADFDLELGKEYVIKRGEQDPAPDAGCSLLEAAIALACAHPNAELAYRADQNTDLLWERGSGGTYNMLFRPQPSAMQIWRSVQSVRVIRQALHDTQNTREGRAAAIAARGAFLITHVVFQQLPTDSIDDPDFDWARALAEVKAMTLATVARLVYRMDREFGTGAHIASTFDKLERCRLLADAVLADLRSGDVVTELPQEYVPIPRSSRPRRRNAVPTLVEAGRLDEGAPLTFWTSIQAEATALESWLAAEPRRGQATWVNDRREPLLWAADKKQYSPSGLVKKMWEEAGWKDRPLANQGTARWWTSDDESLAYLARVIQDAADEE